MPYLIAYLAGLFTLVALDFVWLGYAMVDFYKAQIGHLMAEQVRFDAAIAFYLLYLIGVVVFVVAPALEARSLRTALWRGVLFGFIAYMTYDLSNLATLRGWPVAVVLADVVWGCVVTASSAVVAYMAASRWRT